MIERLLRTYIIDNADSGVIDRAFGYYPSLISNKENTFLFEVSGSQVSPYDVYIDLRNYYNIKSSCSCSYTGPGICKHQVAAIDELIEIIDNESIDIKPLIEKNPFISSTTVIPHVHGIIDVEELNKMNFGSRSYYYSPMNITSVNKNKIEGVYEDFGEHFLLSLTFNRSNELLALKCSCKSAVPCSHKNVFLREFFKKFGRDYFTENFEERFKQRTMEHSKFDGILDFDEIYEMEISTEGAKVKDKISNISSDDSLLQLFAVDRKDFFLPKNRNRQEGTISF